MLRLIPRPGLLSGLVVAVSVATGVAFGAAVVSAGLALHAARAAMGGKS